MEYETPNNFDSLIIEELQKEKYVGEETIYGNLAKTLREECTPSFIEPIKKDLDFLTEQGTIARYSLDHSRNSNAAFIDFLCDELIYHLPKKIAKLTKENAYARETPHSLLRTA
ncbi:hypothetical protein KAJ87_00015 [Candidatus Pacearchaeota archaeon]|nr:hypothetical protein [Candidatus Pacearchaeota archaeon]